MSEFTGDVEAALRSAEGPGAGTPVTIVVPCYNERSRLDMDAFSSFSARYPDVGFLFVDDGSDDGTGDWIDDRIDGEAAMALLRLDSNRGKGEAVRAGLIHALGRAPQIVGFWDADLATPLPEARSMLDLLSDRPDLQAVIGSRVRLLGRILERHPARHYLGRLFATGASLALDMAVYDTQCGAKLFRVSDTIERVVQQPFRSRWIFDVELLGRLMDQLGPASGGWIEEHPLRHWEDVGGSKLRLVHFLGAGFDLGRIWMGRRFRPGNHRSAGAP
jgi:glycosyltransferase involved in cell wall biosynthesis